jgi:beta-lactam-binding protein with PASTA domain
LPGQAIAKGSKIDLELGEGLGTAQFDAPSVIGMPLDEAKIAIIGAGLKVGQQMIVPAEEGQAAGSVVRQNPDAGNNVRIGDVIDLWVTPQGVEPTENENIQPEQ